MYTSVPILLVLPMDYDVGMCWLNGVVIAGVLSVNGRETSGETDTS